MSPKRHRRKNRHTAAVKPVVQQLTLRRRRSSGFREWYASGIVRWNTDNIARHRSLRDLKREARHTTSTVMPRAITSVAGSQDEVPMRPPPSLPSPPPTPSPPSTSTQPVLPQRQTRAMTRHNGAPPLMAGLPMSGRAPGAIPRGAVTREEGDSDAGKPVAEQQQQQQHLKPLPAEPPAQRRNRRRTGPRRRLPPTLQRSKSVLGGQRPHRSERAAGG